MTDEGNLTVTTRDTALTGAPCWIDLSTSDPDGAIAFYGELFGWTADEPDPEFGGYRNFHLDGGMIAGCMRNLKGEERIAAGLPAGDEPDSWTVYFATDDAGQAAARCAELGATVVAPPMQVGEFGSMAVLVDPSGALVGLWQPDTHHGFHRLGEPGAPGWFELHTTDYAGSVGFYRSALPGEVVTMADGEDFRYSQLVAGGEEVAGIMDATVLGVPAGPARWEVYLCVADTDATVARLVELGGSVRREPADSPYGRLAEVTDPYGADFRLVDGRQSPA